MAASTDGAGKESQPQVFEFTSFGDYLGALIEARKSGARPLSIRNLARRLDGCSPALLSMIIKGNRRASPELVESICDYFELATKAREYARTLNELERARSNARREEVLRKLRRMAPSNSELVLALETMTVLSKWYHFVILEMTELERFDEQPVQIAEVLGSGVTADQVVEAIDRLVQLGLAERTDSGRLIKAKAKIRTPLQASRTIRNFHKQLVLRANQALDKQSIEERYFTGLTIPVPVSKLPEAFSKIAEFRNQFAREMTENQDGSEEVYQLNLNFFRATALRVGSPDQPSD